MVDMVEESSRDYNSIASNSRVTRLREGEENHHHSSDDQNPPQNASLQSSGNVGTSIHTHTFSEEVTSVMKQMEELQCRYDRLLANKADGSIAMPPLPSEGVAVDSTTSERAKRNSYKFLMSPYPQDDAGKTSNVGAPAQADSDAGAIPLPTKTCLSEARYTGWKDFKSVVLENETEYAVEVLLGPAKFYWQRQVDSRRAINLEEEGVNLSSPTDLMKAQREMPERIRINSPPLLAILKELAPEHFGGYLDKPTVFLRPFKLFSTHEVELRQYWRDWKSRMPEDNTMIDNTPACQPLSSSLESDKPTASTSDTFERSDSQQAALAAQNARPRDISMPSHDALVDLGCLLSVMDQHISPVIEQYRSTSIRQVRFRDLWHLYQPGDEIVCLQDLYISKSKAPSFATTEGSRDGDPALWRVLQVSSGRPVLCSPKYKDDGPIRFGVRAPVAVPSTIRAPAVKCNTLKILCYMLGYDGSKFGPIHHTFEIKPFEGLQDVSSLELIPGRLYGHMQELRSRLISRGRTFMSTTSPAHFVYTGQTLMHHPGGQPCPLVRRTQPIDGSVVVDFKEAYRANQKWVLGLKIPEALGGSGSEVMEDFPVSYWKDKEQKELDGEKEEEIHDDTDIDETAMADFIARDGFLSCFDNKLGNEDVDGSNFSEGELMLLPERVVAFDLHSRRYIIIGIDGLQPVEVKAEGWGDLKLPRGHKKMVQAQVEMHFREKEIRQQYPGRQGDLVRGKGQGLIILLHGAPGTGKTSTAECVAEFLRRPLYPITCGDLGVTAQEVEETLSETFARAEAWDCVLLLDEADVFLAQRTRTDLKRNAVVSVFLRVLEYYKGILFLTTNRVGAFDEAFKSRIHLHLYYPILNKDQTMSIWQMNLDRLSRQRGTTMQVDDDAVLQYAEAHFEYHKQKNTRWNGRQIHNAFQTAAALAEYEALETHKKSANLEVAHFKTVADASHQFDRYISETIGGSESERALNDRERADNFKWSSYQRDFDMNAAQAPGTRGAYQTPSRQWADHDPRASYPPNTSRPPQSDMTDFEEFQRQKYRKQFSASTNRMPGSPMPKPWPRPEEDGHEENSGSHRIPDEDLDRSWIDHRSSNIPNRPQEEGTRKRDPRLGDAGRASHRTWNDYE